MIRILRNYLTRKAIRTERAKALAEYQAAIRAKDTRRKHHAERAAQEATNRALGAGA
jgi:hypothetical protein